MKRPRKKMLAVFTLCILVATSLSGCGNKAVEKTSDPGAQSAASNYPNKPIELILIHKAGSSTDLIARTLQPYLSKELGVQVVVQNVTGGGGTQAMSQLVKDKPDGYTLLMTPFPSATLKQVLNPDVDFDIKNFSYVAGVSGGDDNTIAVATDSPIKSFEDLVTTAKSKNLKIAGSGIATNGHFAAALLQDVGNIKFTYVPFEGGPASLNAVIGNHVDATIASIVGAIPLVNSGQLRLLAVTGSQRDSRFKDVPTVAELGLPDVAFDVKVGIVAPPELPADISKKLSDAIEKVVTNPEFISAGEKVDFTAVYCNGDDLKSTSLKLIDMVTKQKAALSSTGN